MHDRLRFDPSKPLAVGGQAVIEGVMMRAPGRIATAVRRKNGTIVVRKRDYVSLAEKYAIFKLPILRGAVGLVEMMFAAERVVELATDPEITWVTCPAYFRPIVPCPRMSSPRSAGARSNQFTCSPRRFDIG